MKSTYKFLICNGLYILVCYLFLFERALLIKVDISAVFGSLIAISSVVLAIIGMWVSYQYQHAITSVITDSSKIDLVDTLKGAKRQGYRMSV
ncbi:hypothetical protein [Shewanella sp. T24-MNA-CIBAN-0130]|uniref:hypothetical protein n=1 Tax=Shewanella sp. T24-MNA-CIBAN-0130 TaxID=3140470 RepID=UPI00332517ED